MAALSAVKLPFEKRFRIVVRAEKHESANHEAEEPRRDARKQPFEAWF